MLGKRLINSNDTGGGCTTDTLQILGDTSCISTYKLDSNANDLSGNYNGTATDVSYVAGKFNNAAYFNGISSGISVSQDFGIGDISKNWTSSVWAKTNSTIREWVYYARQTNNHTLSLNNGSVVIGFYLSAGGNDISITGIDTTSWNHIVVSHDAATTTATIYVNGVQKTTINTSGTQSLSVNNFTFAEHPTISTEFSECNIDQARFFNKALDSTEVTTLYNEVAC